MLWNYLYTYYNNKSDMDDDTLDVLARLSLGVAAASEQAGPRMSRYPISILSSSISILSSSLSMLSS